MRDVTNTLGAVAGLGLAALLTTGCAQPGQLGAAEATPVPAAAPGREAAAPAGPVLVGSGRVEVPVTVQTPGPAVFSVRTVVVPPGGSTGWHRHPGTEMSIVKSGSITLLRAGGCAPVRYDADQAVFIPDAQPHLARNDGPVAAEIVVTYLLAPGAPDRGDLPPAC